MRLVPDHFFCVLSTLLDSLSPEEIGSPFSAKSRFVQRVRSSLPVACGIWMACPPPLPPESGVYARVQAKIKVGDQRVNGCVRACLKSCEHYCLPDGCGLATWRVFHILSTAVHGPHWRRKIAFHPEPFTGPRHSSVAHCTSSWSHHGRDAKWDVPAGVGTPPDP